MFDSKNINREENFHDILGSVGKALFVALCAVAAHSKNPSSAETCRFLFGQNYQSIFNVITNARNNNFKDVVPLASFITSLLPLEDLEALKQWFLSRKEENASLTKVITGQEFELFCQKRLLELGWNAKTTSVTGDFGADLVVERDGATIIIQCKYYSKPVGVDAVQQVFAAMTFYKAQKAAVVSNQSYTKAARQMAQSNSVALLHMNELDKL